MLKNTKTYIKISLINLIPNINHLCKPMFILGLFIFLGCKKSDTAIGAEVIPDQDDITVHYTDTVTVELQTWNQDTVRSDEPKVQMFGSILDPEFGRLDASSFAQFVMTGSSLFLGDSLSLDSIVLSLDMFGYYGDFSERLKLNVYELEQDLNISNAYYTSDTIATIATKNLAINRNVYFTSSSFAQGLRIRLDTSLGNKLLFADSASRSNNAQFIKLFKGLYLGSEPVTAGVKEPGVVYYFNPTGSKTKLSLYYKGKIAGIYYNNLQFDFLMNAEAARFNRIQRSQTEGRLLAEALNNPNTVGKQNVLLQGGSPKTVYVKIPNLSNLGPATINRAELVLRADKSKLGSDNRYAPPSTILACFATLDSLRDQPNFTSSSLDVDRYEYVLPITNYAQRLMSRTISNYGIFIFSQSEQVGLNRVVLGGSSHPTLKPYLRITYTKTPGVK